jgi:hypothetical protein
MTFCTDSTDFLLASISVVAVNCDPLGSSATHYSLFTKLFGIHSSYVNYFRTQSPWLDEYHLKYTVACRTVTIILTVPVMSHSTPHMSRKTPLLYLLYN